MTTEVRHRQARLRSILPGSASLRRTTGDPGTFALTFDDGPHRGGTEAVLAELARADVKATFFVLLDAARAQPTLLTETAAAGHTIGLHADRHERLDRAPLVALTERLVDARRELEDLAGAAVTLHRPPFGRLSLTGARAAHRAGMEVVLWSHDPRDWEQADDLDTRVSSCVVPQAIVLLHDGAATYPGQGEATATALRPALARASDVGLTAVALGRSAA